MMTPEEFERIVLSMDVTTVQWEDSPRMIRIKTFYPPIEAYLGEVIIGADEPVVVEVEIRKHGGG